MAKNTIFPPRPSIRVGGSLLSFEVPKIMAILNLTPDSFYDGGTLLTPSQSLLKAEADLTAGADILDLGAYSTRPGADSLTPAEEWNRLSPHLKLLRKTFPTAVLSIDTFQSSTASNALAEGADMINDVSGGEADPGMFELVAKENVPYILVHSRGTPKTMKQLSHYASLEVEVVDELQKKLSELRGKMVRDVIIDPGFGFAKTIEQNFTLLNNLSDFAIFGLPLLVGLSRKSMIYRSLQIEASEALQGTTAAHVLALERGANILRVHDTLAAVQARKIWMLTTLG